MNSERWKKASLAIGSIIRGLELDQVEFQFDEDAWREVDCLLRGSGLGSATPALRGGAFFVASRNGSAAPGSERSELHRL